jgi:hypothetical protein
MAAGEQGYGIRTLMQQRRANSLKYSAPLFYPELGK